MPQNVWARPGAGNNKRCADCHTEPKDSMLLGGHVRIDEPDMGSLGLLKTFVASVGRPATLSIDVADGADSYAVGIYGVDESHFIADPSWFEQDIAYTSVPTGESTLWSGPKQWIFELSVADTTPDGFYPMEVQVAGKEKRRWVDDEAFYVQVVSIGDMDCDGDVDFDDIDDFVLGLNDAQAYENQFGLPPRTKGDTDGDGDLDFDDIDDFVGILNEPLSVESRTIPEPGTATLFVLSISFLASVGWQRRA